jgi:hypothetical protein
MKGDHTFWIPQWVDVTSLISIEQETRLECEHNKLEAIIDQGGAFLWDTSHQGGTSWVNTDEIKDIPT